MPENALFAAVRVSVEVRVVVGLGSNEALTPAGVEASSSTGLSEGFGLLDQVIGIFTSTFWPGVTAVEGWLEPSRKLDSGGEDGGS